MHTSLWFTDEIETKFQMFQILVWVRYIDIFFFGPIVQTNHINLV